MRRFRYWLLIVGLAGAYYGFQEWRLARFTSPTMQTITCEALARDGYGDNAHVRLSEYLLSPATFVYTEGRGGKRKTVWIPVLPLHGSYGEMVAALPEDAVVPPPKEFGVILQTDHAPDDEALGRLHDAEYLVGVVINEIDSLDRKTRNLLQEGYPGIDLEKCWILEHRRTVRSEGMGLAILGGGGFLVVSGAYLLLRRKRAALDGGTGT